MDGCYCAGAGTYGLVGAMAIVIDAQDIDRNSAVSVDNTRLAAHIFAELERLQRHESWLALRRLRVRILLLQGGHCC